MAPNSPIIDLAGFKVPVLAKSLPVEIREIAFDVERRRRELDAIDRRIGSLRLSTPSAPHRMFS